MNCEELTDSYEAYALGAATDPELSEISAHLRRDCPVCTAGVRAAMSTVSSMVAAVKVVKPPKRLRRRIVASVSPEGGRSWAATLMPWIATAAVAIALISVARTRSGGTAGGRLEQALSILSDPAARDVAFGEPSSRGRIFVSPNRGVVFIAAHLPALEAGKTFELWVIPKTGSPIAGGTFDAGEDSSAVYVRQGAVENAAAIAVTVEPHGGSSAPTTKPFIVTKL